MAHVDDREEAARIDEAFRRLFTSAAGTGVLADALYRERSPQRAIDYELAYELAGVITDELTRLWGGLHRTAALRDESEPPPDSV